MDFRFPGNSGKHNSSLSTKSEFKRAHVPVFQRNIQTLSLRMSEKRLQILQRSNTSLKDLAKVLEDHGRHSMLSFLSSLPISVLRILDTEANKFYDRNHQLYDAALLTRCYTQHALRPFIDSEINHKRHFIKIPYINKGIEFVDLPSIFKG